MQSGYKTITPVQLSNALWSLERGAISHRDLRVYLACAAMVAIREAAARHRAKIRKAAQPLARYQFNELKRLTGLSLAVIRRSLKTLHRAGLMAFTANEVLFTKTPLPGSEGFLEALSCGRSSTRPIPVPRAVLRFLASNRRVALAKTMLAYIVRGLSLSRTGAITSKGTLKINWIVRTLNLSKRAVNYARGELIRLGWIAPDTGSFQRKLNRDGAYFVINLDWSPVMEKSAKAFVKSDNTVVKFAPLPSEKCAEFAPPYKDRKTSIESKNQKSQQTDPVRSGVCLKGEKSCPPDALPTLNAIVPEDFHHLGRLESLHAQAIERGWIPPSEATTLNFVAAAVRAREVGRDSARVFVSLIRNSLWHHITQAQEDKARTALNRCRATNPDRFRLSIRPESIAA